MKTSANVNGMRIKILPVWLLACFLIMAFSSSLDAKEKNRGKFYANEVNFGVGDPLAECLFYRASPHIDYTLYRPETIYLEKQSYHHVPHFYFEYWRNVVSWLAVGAQVDVGSFYWKNVYYNGGSNTPVCSLKQSNYNISILPAVRFAYMRREHVRLYSSIMTGLTINTGSELDYKGRHTAPGFGLQLTWIGVSYMHDHWVGSFELGFMGALGDVNSIFMFGSKLMSLSIGYRF